MAHVGLRPQSVHQMGGYKVQRDAEQLHADARAAQDAGAFSVLLECIPAAIAAEITAELARSHHRHRRRHACDGQVLVINDLLGLTSGYVPRFVKHYADLTTAITTAADRLSRRRPQRQPFQERSRSSSSRRRGARSQAALRQPCQSRCQALLGDRHFGKLRFPDAALGPKARHRVRW